MCHSMHVKTRGHLQELLVSFNHVSPRDITQVTRTGTKHLYLLSRLIDLILCFLITSSNSGSNAEKRR